MKYFELIHIFIIEEYFHNQLLKGIFDLSSFFGGQFILRKVKHLKLWKGCATMVFLFGRERESSVNKIYIFLLSILLSLRTDKDLFLFLFTKYKIPERFCFFVSSRIQIQRKIYLHKCNNPNRIFQFLTRKKFKKKNISGYFFLVNWKFEKDFLSYFN